MLESGHFQRTAQVPLSKVPNPSAHLSRASYILWQLLLNGCACVQCILSVKTVFFCLRLKESSMFPWCRTTHPNIFCKKRHRRFLHFPLFSSNFCPFQCVLCCMLLGLAVKPQREKKLITPVKDWIVCATPHLLIKARRRKYEYLIDPDLQNEKVMAVWKACKLVPCTALSMKPCRLNLKALWV